MSFPAIAGTTALEHTSAKHPGASLNRFDSPGISATIVAILYALFILILWFSLFLLRSTILCIFVYCAQLSHLDRS